MNGNFASVKFPFSFCGSDPRALGRHAARRRAGKHAMTAVDLKGSFDRIAQQYQQARPSYPEAIYERMLEFAAIDSSARLLEVGTGTG
jgi:hypothetical protein